MSETTEQRTGIAWGDPITSERLAELKVMFERQKIWAAQKDRNIEQSVFKGVKLTGADVFWLAALSITEKNKSLETAAADLRAKRNLGLAALHLEGADLRESRLENASLNGSQLSQASLVRANLEGTDFSYANLEGADLIGARLKGAILKNTQLSHASLVGVRLKGYSLIGAQLRGAVLWKAHLEEADLLTADLRGANLCNAHLEKADLYGADLTGADLQEARLDGAILIEAQLAGANLRKARLETAILRRASFDKTSKLNDVSLDRASLDQVSFDNVNLHVVNWELVPILGDELEACNAQDALGQTKSSTERAKDFAAAARSYRSLASTLQSQGMAKDPDHYSHRAQIMRRKQFWYQRRYGAYLGSGLLAVSAGYGYRPQNIFGVYVGVVSIFALCYLLADLFGSPAAFTWQTTLDAAQISLNAIHGRVFFAQFNLDTVQSWLATLESLLGIIIESIFVAVLIQRLFPR